MYKRSVKYIDFDGNPCTDEFYFNLTKTELAEMELSKDGGLTKTVEKIVETKDKRQLMDIFKELLIKSVGDKSVDGKRFMKNDTIRENFVNSAAYDELFMELATNEESAIAFINGITPPVPKQ